MKCEKCGTEIKEDCLFCHNCGTAVQIVPDYEPELDDLHIKIASAQTKMPNRPTARQIEEKKEESLKTLKKANWKRIFFVGVVIAGIMAFALSYSAVLRKQEPGAMQKKEDFSVDKEPEQQILMKPEFSIPPGEYTYYIHVALTSGTEGTIFYTLDGSIPDENSSQYTEPLKLGKGVTVIRAYVMDEDGNSSEIASGSYQVEFGAPERPEITPESGDYVGENYIRITVPEGCLVYYTLDGTEPTESSDVYNGEFLMPMGTTTVKTIAVDDNEMRSEINIETYTCIEELIEE